MKRDVSLKPRKTETRPPEELFRILCGIYPLEVAQEIFERLSRYSKGGHNGTANT